MTNEYPPPSALRPRVRPPNADRRELIHELRKEIRELRAENASLTEERRHRLIDPLTGLCGRRYFDRRLRQELSRADRFDIPLSLVVVDIADLRMISERAGEDAGDRVLRWVAELLAHHCKECDVPCRIGWDEFALVLTHTKLADAYACVDELTHALRNTGDAPTLPGGMQVNLSFGVGAYPEKAETLLELVFEAEESMLEAKQAGPKSERCIVAA